MSGNYQNEAAGLHDDAAYDPSLHDNQIVAVFENRAAAQRAHDALVSAGIPQNAIAVLDRPAGQPVASSQTATRVEDEGFWGSVKSLFAPDEDYRGYHEAIDRGHAMVIVTPTSEMDRHQIVDVLERSDPIDFESRMSEWREAGSRAAIPGATPQPLAMGAGVNRSAESIPAASLGETARSDRAVAGMAPGDETLQVVEERLRIGKREAAKGAVRVRSYVVERPVEEQVRLRDETVTVDRHKVDRPLEPGTDAFKERTIEVRATGEEAVVTKEARVVEEIGIHKEATERTETVRDTVRETKVEIEDGRTTPGGTSGNKPLPRT